LPYRCQEETSGGHRPEWGGFGTEGQRSRPAASGVARRDLHRMSGQAGGALAAILGREEAGGVADIGAAGSGAG